MREVSLNGGVEENRHDKADLDVSKVFCFFLFFFFVLF